MWLRPGCSWDGWGGSGGSGRIAGGDEVSTMGSARLAPVASEALRVLVGRRLRSDERAEGSARGEGRLGNVK